MNSLNSDAPSNNSAFSATLEDFLYSLEKLENDFKLLINSLKTLTFIPKSCEFSTWELILQNLITELHRASAAIVIQPPEESFKIVEGVYEIRDSLVSQLLMGLIHRKIVLWMDLGILETGYVKGEILDSVRKIIDFRDAHGYIPTKIEYTHPKKPEFPSIESPVVKFDVVSLVNTFT